MNQHRNPTRTRRRLLSALAIGLALILPSAIALQMGWVAEARPVLLALLGLGCVAALPATLAFSILHVRALADPGLNDQLNDELSTRNSVRALAVGYIAAVSVAGYALPLSVFVDLPTAPILTGVVLIGVIAHIVSFVIFERQGDDG